LFAVGGRLGGVNSEGVAFYNRLIDALLQKGIISQSLSSSFSKLHVSHIKKIAQICNAEQAYTFGSFFFEKIHHQE
jgi:hypothetical protein